MGQATGRVTIKLDTATLRSKNGATIQVGGIQREFDVTDQSEAFFREKVVVASIRATIVHMADTDLLKLRTWKNGTAFFRTDTGRTYTIAHAAVASIGDLANGECEVVIMGDPAAQ